MFVKPHFVYLGDQGPQLGRDAVVVRYRDVTHIEWTEIWCSTFAYYGHIKQYWNMIFCESVNEVLMDVCVGFGINV